MVALEPGVEALTPSTDLSEPPPRAPDPWPLRASVLPALDI